jgi:phenylpropionate dioxygenase-like ring-hydroxylating dioxygenase large terminal subunit
MTALHDPVAWNEWYVLSWGGEIPAGTRETTRLLGEPVTIARDADGRVTVTRTDADGAVVPVTTRERHGFIWATFGTPARDIVDVPEFEDTARRLCYRGRIGVPSSGQRVVENFIDLSHFSFVHTGTLGGYDASEVPRYDVEFREQAGELWATGCSFFQPKASAAAGTSTQVYYDYRVHSPFVVLLYKDSLVRPGRKDVIGLFIQPLGEEDCIVHSFALVHDEVNSDTHILHFYHEIFAQDRMVLFHQRPRKLPVHPKREVPMISDASSIAFRRWLDRSGLRFGIDRDPS